MMWAKKSLGQNFLKSPAVLGKIISAGEIAEGDTVLEIGPGKGTLTELLVERVGPAQNGRGKVIAVEKDEKLFEFLQTKFAEEIKSGKLISIRDDILNLNASAHRLEPSGYKIIANIPYNITGAVLKKFLTAKNQPSLMVLMLQKEVAQRIMDKKGSLLSVSTKVYGSPSMVAKVPARFFSPRPKVDSAIIKIEDISRKNFTQNGVKEEKFFEIVRAGFGHKRKKLQNNLKNSIPKEKLAELGFADKRAEDLSPKDWFGLVKSCYN